MNSEYEIYGELTSYTSKNFDTIFLPYQSFLNDVFEYVSNSDNIIKEYNVKLIDMSKFTSMLTNDIAYNKAFLEIIFMYMTNFDLLDDEERLNEIFDEFNGGAFEAIVNIDTYNKNKHLFNRELIIKLLTEIYLFLEIKDKDLIVVGWLKNKLLPNTIGVMYV